MVTIQQYLMLSNSNSIHCKINHCQPHAITAGQHKHLKHFQKNIKDIDMVSFKQRLVVYQHACCCLTRTYDTCKIAIKMLTLPKELITFY